MGLIEQYALKQAHIHQVPHTMDAACPSAVVAALILRLNPRTSCEQAHLGYYIGTLAVVRDLPLIISMHSTDAFQRGLYTAMAITQPFKSEHTLVSCSQRHDAFDTIRREFKQHWIGRQAPITRTELLWWRETAMPALNVHTSSLVAYDDSYAAFWGHIYPEHKTYFDALALLDSEALQHGVSILQYLHAHTYFPHTVSAVDLPMDMTVP